jgi:AP-2 complex subunit sigma-1
MHAIPTRLSLSNHAPPPTPPARALLPNPHRVSPLTISVFSPFVLLQKIRFLLLQNRQGKTRVAKWYVQPAEGEKAWMERQKLEKDIHRMVTTRDSKFTNFVEFRTYKIIYRRYAGLFFTVGVDIHDNELVVLELIHLFVETLDTYFKNVCELDIVFNFQKVYSILDQIIMAGEVMETSKFQVCERLAAMEKLVADEEGPQWAAKFKK